MSEEDFDTIIEEYEQALANMQREYDKRGDRIEELEAACWRMQEERDEWQSLAEAAIKDDAAKNIHYAEIQAKLAKAVETLKRYGGVMPIAFAPIQDGGYKARTTLAELKGGDA